MMVQVKLPDSDPARLSMMSRSASTGWNDRQQGRHFVDEETLHLTIELYRKFKEDLNALNNATAARKEASAELDAALETLTPYVRETCSSLRRQVSLKLLPGKLLAYFGLSAQGDTPFPRVRAEWVEWGLQMQQGDDDAQNAGYSGIPYRSEITAGTMATQYALHRLDNADEVLNPLQEQVSLTRAEVDELTREIRLQLRFALRKKTPAQQRKVLYAYGLRRRYSENAKVEDTGTPNADQTDTSTANTNTTNTNTADSGAAADSAANPDASTTPTTSEDAAGIPIYYQVPLTLQSNGDGMLYTNGNGSDGAV